MVLDTSAIIAIIARELSANRLSAAVDAADTRLISAASMVEASMVLLGRRGELSERLLDQFVREINADIEPVTTTQAQIAREAATRFGRGRHPAALNFGDCFCYALSIDAGEPLLFVGDGFSRTDVEVAPW